MQVYELTTVLTGNATPAKIKSFEKNIKDILTSVEGKVKTVKNWGKRDLAYIINHNSTGVYLFYELELEPKGVKILSGKLNTDDGVLRYLLIKKD